MRPARPPSASLDARVRVLTLTRDVGSGYGGAEKVAFEFARRLDSARFKSYLCLTHAPEANRRAPTDSDVAELRAAGVGVLRLERTSSLSVLPWARLYRLLVGESIDVLHAHMPRASIPGTVIGRLARVPVIVSHEHTWSFQGQPMRRFLDRNIVARGSDVVLAVSREDRQKIIEVEHIPPDCIRVLSNGIPSPPEDGPDVRIELGVGPEVALIGSVGRFYPQKGYDDLVRAIALLKQQSPMPTLCVIAGDGPGEAELLALIRQLDVADEVRLLGRRQDVSDVIRALDVAVLSSKWEGSPLTLMEYMAGAAPIVSTAVGGVPELVENGVHGLLVQPRDPAALAVAIRRLLEDRELARRLGQAAQRRQRAEFDLDVTIGRLEDLYLELYGRSRRVPLACGSSAR